MIAETFHLSEGERHLLLSADVGEGLMFAGPAHAAVRVIASPEEHELVTTKPQDLEAQRTKQQNAPQTQVPAPKPPQPTPPSIDQGQAWTPVTPAQDAQRPVFSVEPVVKTQSQSTTDQ